MAVLYPLKFQPIYKEKIWAGSQLKSFLTNSNIPQNTGEVWQISAVQENLSVVSNGFLKGNNIEEILEIYMGDIVGDSIYEKFGVEFPILIKYIATGDKLSVQVHPNDELAKKKHNAFGKNEMWYALDSYKGEILTGFKQNTSRKEVLGMIKNNTIQSLINHEAVSSGDVFFIPAGQIHAIGEGILVAEIQQTSDITYRVFDWDRKNENGEGRELHIDLALDALDYKKNSHIRKVYTNKMNSPVMLVASNSFTTNKLNLNKEYEADYHQLDSFVIYMCIGGKAEIICDNGAVETISKGETILIPSVIENVKIKPESYVNMLEIYIQLSSE